MTDRSETITRIFLDAADRLNQRGIHPDDICAGLVNAAATRAVESDGLPFAARMLRQAAVELEQRIRKARELN